MQFEVNSEVFLSLGLWLIPVALLLMAVKQLFPMMRFRSEEKRMKVLLSGVSDELLRDINIPDGMDGMVHIDYLLLTPAGLIVVDVEHRDGSLFGSEKIDLWTQAVGMKTSKFMNPLHNNKLKISAVKGVVPGIDVTGRVVFVGGEFVKGKPDGVSMYDEVKDDLAPLNELGTLSALLLDSWNHLKQMSKEEREGRRSEGLKVPSKFRAQVLKAILLVILALGLSGFFLSFS